MTLARRVSGTRLARTTKTSTRRSCRLTPDTPTARGRTPTPSPMVSTANLRWQTKKCECGRNRGLGKCPRACIRVGDVLWCASGAPFLHRPLVVLRPLCTRLVVKYIVCANKPRTMHVCVWCSCCATNATCTLSGPLDVWSGFPFVEEKRLKTHMRNALGKLNLGMSRGGKGLLSQTFEDKLRKRMKQKGLDPDDPSTCMYSVIVRIGRLVNAVMNIFHRPCALVWVLLSSL